MFCILTRWARGRPSGTLDASVTADECPASCRSQPSVHLGIAASKWASSLAPDFGDEQALVSAVRTPVRTVLAVSRLNRRELIVPTQLNCDGSADAGRLVPPKPQSTGGWIVSTGRWWGVRMGGRGFRLLANLKSDPPSREQPDGTPLRSPTARSAAHRRLNPQPA